MGYMQEVKSRVSCLEAAQRYGLELNRNEMARCPFHPDRRPSMKVWDDHYHCFSCGAHGDVIDLTARLLGVSLAAAAKALRDDIGVGGPPVQSNPLLDEMTLERTVRSLLKKKLALLEQEADRRYGGQTPDALDPELGKLLSQFGKYQSYLDILDQGSTVERRAAVEDLMEEGVFRHGST